MTKVHLYSFNLQFTDNPHEGRKFALKIFRHSQDTYAHQRTRSFFFASVLTIARATVRAKSCR